MPPQMNPPVISWLTVAAAVAQAFQAIRIRTPPQVSAFRALLDRHVAQGRAVPRSNCHRGAPSRHIPPLSIAERPRCHAMACACLANFGKSRRKLTLPYASTATPLPSNLESHGWLEVAQNRGALWGLRRPQRATVRCSSAESSSARSSLPPPQVMPKQARRGILHPTTWAEPGRLIGRALRPWRLIGSQGTAAADPSHLPFGTQLYVPGHGWCKVEDTGGDILG